MSRIIRSSCAAAAFAAVAAGAIGMTASASAAAAPSAADKTFMAANAQTNLAEMTLGKLAMSRASSSAVKMLAQKTMTDHKTAQAKLTKVADSLKVTLPGAPNATQKSQAAQLQSLSGSSFDQLYLRDQAAGHQLSITGTQKELSGGSSDAVTTYARGYLPVAQMHLQMAQADLKSGSGSGPGLVQAGSGGGAATGDSAAAPIGWITLAAVLTGLGGVTLLVDRRRRVVRR